MPRTGQPSERHLTSVQRAIAVLETLAETEGGLGTNEVARRTDINPSTVSRVLATLAAGGLVEHIAESGRYRLGLRLLQLGHAALGSLGLRDLAHPHLTELTQLTGETATLSVAGEGEAITLDYVPSPASVRSEATVGRTSAAHATAVGKVFLAHGGTLPEGPLKAFTDRTITDPAAIAEEVRTVRERGWAQALGEREEDLNGVAVPVLDHAGALIGILGLQGPAARFTPDRVQHALPHLRERAALLGQR